MRASIELAVASMRAHGSGRELRRGRKHACRFLYARVARQVLGHPAAPLLFIDCMKSSPLRVASDVSLGFADVSALLELADHPIDRSMALSASLLTQEIDAVVGYAEGRGELISGLESTLVALAWRVLGEPRKALSCYKVGAQSANGAVRRLSLAAARPLARAIGARSEARQLESRAGVEVPFLMQRAQEDHLAIRRIRSDCNFVLGGLDACMVDFPNSVYADN